MSTARYIVGDTRDVTATLPDNSVDLVMTSPGNDRDAIGIDIDERNADLAIERLGMFVTIEHHTQQVPA